MHLFVEMSIQAAYMRVVDILDAKSKETGKHSLALLAHGLMSIYERESVTFTPVLCRQYPEAGRLSSLLLHQLYWEQLEPFLEGISDFSEVVRSVLAEANSLECCLVRTFHSVSGENQRSYLIDYLHPYQLSHISAPLILHWVNAQHGTMLDCTKRAIHIEDWEPMSSQLRQGASIIEIFRIIEEAIDQFFNLKLPMDIIHLRSLLIGIVRSLEAYLQDMINHQVDKHILYPSRPALTRYKESVNPLMKKKPVEHMVPEEKIISQLNHLTASKLCVKLNTLHYIRDQLDMLEDSIKQSWKFDRPVKCETFGDPEENLCTTSESIEEIFTIFDDIKRSTFDVSDIIFDFIGTRVIFWDMRDSFLFTLYRGNVESARLEICVPQLDAVLNDICDVIIDTLRDQVVLSICQASMDGYVWVMLDGGPSRVFSESDTTMMQEDLNILKDLFIANGEGLPTVAVEKEAALAQQIIELYSLKPELIIDMLLSATQQMSIQPSRKKPGKRSPKDVDTLLRVLCHNKDEHASEFLKMQYELPKSSDYEDNTAKDEAKESDFLGDILKRSSSFNWSEKGQTSFRVVMKKLHEAKFEIRQPPRG